MKALEIKALENGAHRNQTSDTLFPLLDGWALVPENMELENFPFGEVTAEEINGVMIVTDWKPGVMPEPVPVPEPEPTAEEITDILLGVTE